MYHFTTKRLQSATAELAEKMRLENLLEKDVRRLFVGLSRDFTASVRGVGRIPDAEIYEPGFNAALMQQYTRTQRAFSGMITDQILSDERDALFTLAKLEWRTVKAPVQARIITNTNMRQMDEALAMGREELAQSDVDLTPIALSRISTSILTARFLNPRINIIGQTETQDAAESTKQIEAEVIAGRRPFPLQDTIIEPQLETQTVTKTWDTIGDRLVRASHVAANGVMLPNDGIFNIGGSQLRFPGDTGLGAAFRELVNCRCSSNYGISS
jgi:hypothetical protein